MVSCVYMLSHSVMSDSVALWPVACKAALSMEFSGQNTGVGCHFLLQEIFLTQDSNPCLLRLLNWQAGSLLLVELEKPSCFLSLQQLHNLSLWFFFSVFIFYNLVIFESTSQFFKNILHLSKSGILWNFLMISQKWFCVPLITWYYKAYNIHLEKEGSWR